MKRCLFLIFIKSYLLLALAEEEAATGSNMSNYSTLVPKINSTTSSEAAVNTVHTSTESKHLISASTGIPPSIPNVGPRFHAGSFIGGMMLAFFVLLAITVGYRLICSQREIRYRVIEEHDAII